jgi:predicted house-cleaning NTP pyrophosphatase (Maf/HAM1 superfamily)
MPNELPDRLSVNPESPYYNEEVLKQVIGIRFNGVERKNVEEYCVSEGWIRVAAGKSVDRRGRPLMMKISGTVEPFFKEADA